MPLYDYKCRSCGETFEVLQKFGAEPLKTHKKCGGPVERLLSTASFRFKGTGWYATDYAKKSNGKSLPAPKPAETKSDAKPASAAVTTASSDSAKKS